MQRTSLGIVGHGHFGTLVHELVARFSPKTEVRIFSRGHAPDGKTFFTLEEVAVCDAVVITVPIHEFEATLKALVPLVRKDTVIVDISTVKMHTVKHLRKYARGKQWIATHPMWGPESYKKRGGDVTGFRIIVCERTLPESQYRALKLALQRIGFEVVEMSARQHDKHLAETLFLTHYIGQIIHRAGFDRTAIDTVSFGFLMDAVESVKHDTKLFRDVFEFNPYCREIMDRFELSEQVVRKMLG